MITYSLKELQELNIKCPRHNKKLKFDINYQSFTCDDCINYIVVNMINDCEHKYFLKIYCYFHNFTEMSLSSIKGIGTTFITKNKSQIKIPFQDLSLHNYNEEAEKLLNKLKKLVVFS